MNYDATSEKIISFLRGKETQGYEIYMESGRSLTIEASDGNVENFTSSAPAGVSLRVLKNGGIGFSFSTALDDASLALMVESALVSARYQTPDPAHDFPLPAAYPDLPFLYDPKLGDISEELKVGRALELEALARQADPRVVRVRKATYSETVAEVRILNSRGVEGSCRSTMVSASVSAIAEGEGESRLGWDFAFGRSFDAIDPPALAAAAAARATGLLGAVTVESMNCPILLDPYVASEILEVLAPSFLAENIEKGKSLLGSRLGEQVFSPLLAIRDDGTCPDGGSAFPFDGEGVPAGPTEVVENGVLRGFLYDTLRGRKQGVPSTGNSVRDGLRTPPRNSITNFFIPNGMTPPVDLLAGIRRGLLLIDVMGMHTANPISGDFSVGAAGFLVEEGVVTRPVKGAISGNVVELFRSVRGIGNDLRFFGAVGAPSLLVSSLDVSGT